jgi:hypothetical protein
MKKIKFEYRYYADGTLLEKNRCERSVRSGFSFSEFPVCGSVRNSNTPFLMMTKEASLLTV